jgi:hypothetical protein
MADGCRWMVSSSGRPSGVGGDGAAVRVVDVRWRVSAAGASNHSG